MHITNFEKNPGLGIRGPILSPGLGDVAGCGVGLPSYTYAGAGGPVQTTRRQSQLRPPSQGLRIRLQERGSVSQAVYGIRDILVRIWIMDPDPDPTPFFNDFKDVKKLFSFLFFSYKLPTATSSSVLKINFLK
jgi:hypothetical protein